MRTMSDISQEIVIEIAILREVLNDMLYIVYRIYC